MRCTEELDLGSSIFRKNLLLMAFITLLFMPCALVFSSGDNVLEMAIESAALLKKSKAAFFPFNILYYYVGINQLGNAISKDPTNLDLRLIRASTLFDFVDKNPVAQDIVVDDLEFFLIFKDRYQYTSKISTEIVYYILSYVFALKKNHLKAHYYFEKLKSESPSNPFLDKLETRFPQFFQRR